MSDSAATPPPSSTPSSSSTDSSTGTSTSTTSTESGWRRWSVLLPALTFAAGLALGAAVVGVSQLGGADDDPLAAPSPSASPTRAVVSPTPGDLRITVPAPCVQAAEKAETAYGVLDRAVEAVRELDARALADVVDVAQTERAETEALVEACQAAAGAQLVQPAPTAPPAAEATPTS